MNDEEKALELIKDIYNLHIKGFEGFDFNATSKDKYELI